MQIMCSETAQTAEEGKPDISGTFRRGLCVALKQGGSSRGGFCPIAVRDVLKKFHDRDNQYPALRLTSAALGKL